MKPSEALAAHRANIRRIVESHHAGNARVFGSVVHGLDHDASDLDILVDVADRIGIIPGTTICGLSDGAGWPVKTAIRKFRQEFEDAIRTGRKSVVKSLPMAGAH